MKIVNFFKTLVAPSANEQLAKLDAHLLADIGVIITCDRDIYFSKSSKLSITN